MPITVTPTDQVRAQLLRLGSRLSGRALAQAAEDVETYIHTQAAEHTQRGNLAASVYKAHVAPDVWEIGHDLQRAPHAQWVINGSRPHEIRARNKQALRYVHDGVFWFWFGPKPKPQQGSIRQWVRRVAGAHARVVFRWPHHPGYVGDPYIRRAAALAPQMLKARIDAELARSKE
jgi:hypothetical protein